MITKEVMMISSFADENVEEVETHSQTFHFFL